MIPSSAETADLLTALKALHERLTADMKNHYRAAETEAADPEGSLRGASYDQGYADGCMEAAGSIAALLRLDAALLRGAATQETEK